MARLFLGLAWALLALSATANDNSSGRAYLPLPDVQAAIDQTLSQAHQADKQALIIMGANWCHDSRALAEHLQQADTALRLGERFEILYVDVGFLAENFDVNRRFGLPAIFGTPTVLAVAPGSQALLNRDTLHTWSSAASFSAEETLAKLESLPRVPAESAPDNATAASLMAQIDTYEREQAQRILAGYAVVGPMLEALKKGEKAEDFEPYWDQLRAMRSQLPRDLLQLRQEARQRADAGETDIQLEFPVYPAFDWE